MAQGTKSFILFDFLLGGELSDLTLGPMVCISVDQIWADQI